VDATNHLLVLDRHPAWLRFVSYGSDASQQRTGKEGKDGGEHKLFPAEVAPSRARGSLDTWEKKLAEFAKGVPGSLMSCVKVVVFFDDEK